MFRAAVIGLAALALAGCKDDAQCERLRVDLAKTYGTLRESAGKRKLAGVDVQGWTNVEETAALLESSFMTPRVTWQSAEKAKAELSGKLSGLQTDSEANLTGYRLSVDAALKQQEEFTRQCR
jgi:hypothetical protein